MRKLHVLIIVIGIALCYNALSQTTITLEASKDVMIRYFGSDGDTQNYGSYPYINMHAWTNGGYYVVHRSLIDFDLSIIGPGSEILNAILKLYSDRSSTLYPDGHQYLYDYNPNECEINRIVQPWIEDEINWTIKPSVTYHDEMHVAPSHSNFQDYQINVTNLVQDMIDNPDSNFGFQIKLENEQPYSRMVFASSNNENPDIHPVLEITYLTSGIKQSVSTGFKIYPNPASDKITIDFGNIYENDKFTIHVLNVLGQTVKTYSSIGKCQFTIDLGQYDDGIYVLRILQKGKRIYSSEVVVWR